MSRCLFLLVLSSHISTTRVFWTSPKCTIDAFTHVPSHLVYNGTGFSKYWGEISQSTKKQLKKQLKKKRHCELKVMIDQTDRWTSKDGWGSTSCQTHDWEHYSSLANDSILLNSRFTQWPTLSRSRVYFTHIHVLCCSLAAVCLTSRQKECCTLHITHIKFILITWKLSLSLNHFPTIPFTDITQLIPASWLEVQYSCNRNVPIFHRPWKWSYCTCLVTDAFRQSQYQLVSVVPNWKLHVIIWLAFCCSSVSPFAKVCSIIKGWNSL